MKTLILLAFVLSFSFSHAAIEVKSTPADGDVQFDAIGKPAMIKIKGKGEGAVADLKIDQGKLNGTVSFKLETLDTGMNMRNEHMKEKYLNVKTFPTAVLTFKDFALPASFSAKNPVLKETDFSGMMKLHGIEKEIKGKFEIVNDKLAGHANYEIKLSDFGIDIPTYLGVKVADIVKVSVNFEKMNLTETKTEPAAKKK